jgi:N-methylhydantoinase B
MTGATPIRELDAAAFAERYGCDRFTATVVASRFRYAVGHMSTHLLTNAFSVILRDWYDFAATLSGPPDMGYPMPSVSNSLMGFLGTMADAVRNSVGEFEPDQLRPGDVLICNDPYRTGTHVNDICFMRPIFHAGRLQGFVNIQAHMLDIGGTVPGGFSGTKRNIYENGLVLAPQLLYRDDAIVRSALSVILDNVRFGSIILPDIRSIYANLRLGERLIEETIERYGIEAYRGTIRYAVDTGAEAMADALRALPDGVYEGEEVLDCDAIDDEEYRVRVKVTVAGHRAEVDLSGTSRQARTSINGGWLDTKTATAVALKYLLDPHTPFTSGALRHVDIVLPPGTVASAMPPDGAICLYWEVTAVVIIALFRAFATALGADAIGGDFTSTMLHNAYGARPDGSQWTSLSQCGGEHGPWGATRHADAENSMTIYQSNGIAPAVEAIEADAPVVVMRKEYVADTGGAGVHRGGAAVRKDSVWLTDAEHFSSALHTKRPSGFGVHGGRDGPPGGVWLWPGGDDVPARFIDVDDGAYAGSVPVAGVLDPERLVLDREHGSYFSFAREPVWRTSPGAVFRYQTNAGGGWGDPLQRDPARVMRDVRDEYVSVEGARREYGVVVIGDPLDDPEGLRIDEAATAALRAGRSASGG